MADVHAVHIIDEGDDNLVVREAMQKLFGLYDRGGILAIAMKKDVVVSAGREGGVEIFSIGENIQVFIRAVKVAVLALLNFISNEKVT